MTTHRLNRGAGFGTALLQTLPIRWQLGIGFAAAVALSAACMLFISAQLGQLASAVQQINRQTLPLVLAVDEMDLSRSDVQQFLTDVAATHDEGAYKEVDAAVARFARDAELFRQHYRAANDTRGLA